MSRHRRDPRNKDRPLPPLRAHLRAKLVQRRDRLAQMVAEDNETTRQEAGWPYESTAYRMGQTYGLDRIEKIDAGDPVEVYLWEVSDLVPANQREGIYEGTRMVLETDGRLRPC